MLLAPVDMKVNPAIPHAVWEAFDALPSQTLPRKVARPVRRLAALAQALSRDGLRANARKDAYRVLFGKLDGLLAQHRKKVADASKGILQVDGETLVVRVVGGEVRDEGAFVEAADELSVEADFRAAGRVITPDLARQYADHLSEDDEDEDGLFDAHVKVAALAKVEGVADELDLEADRLCGKWRRPTRVKPRTKGLSDRPPITSVRPPTLPASRQGRRAVLGATAFCTRLWRQTAPLSLDDVRPRPKGETAPNGPISA